jgi:hypothetical protein
MNGGTNYLGAFNPARGEGTTGGAASDWRIMKNTFAWGAMANSAASAW